MATVHIFLIEKILCSPIFTFYELFKRFNIMKISKLFEKTEEKEFTTFPATLETYAGINVAMWSFQP